MDKLPHLLAVVSAVFVALLIHYVSLHAEELRLGSVEPLVPRTLHKSSRIAIVGGGVSGLSAAETLVKHGFTNVVVYEARSTVVPLQHAVKTPDYVYDMDLVYVPALSWTGASVEDRYAAILKEYDQELVVASEFTKMSFEDWHLEPDSRTEIDGRMVPTLHPYTKIQFTPENGRSRFDEQLRFVRKHGAFFQEHQYGGVKACLDNEFARKNETFDDWSRRHNYPVFRERVAHLLSLYGNFPVGESPACQVLMIMANKMPSVIGPALGVSALQTNFPTWMREFGGLEEPLMGWIRSLKMKGFPSFMHRFKKSHADFFATVVRQNGLNYRTNTRVERLLPLVDPATGRKRVEVEFSDWTKPSEIVDHVIVAGRPDQVYSVLPDDHPMKSLYNTVKREAETMTRNRGVYGSAVVSYDVSSNAGFVAQDLFVIDHQKHLKPTSNGTLTATVNLMRMVKMAPAKIITVVFQTKTHAAGSEEERLLLVKELELYGFFNIQVMKMVHYPKTPTRVPLEAVVDGWYDKAEAAQGHQEIYYVGETFSGHGVPTTFIHTRDWITRTFNLSAFDAVAAAGEHKFHTVHTEAAEKLPVFAATGPLDGKRVSESA